MAVQSDEALCHVVAKMVQNEGQSDGVMTRQGRTRAGRRYGGQKNLWRQPASVTASHTQSHNNTRSKHVVPVADDSASRGAHFPFPLRDTIVFSKLQTKPALEIWKGRARSSDFCQEH